MLTDNNKKKQKFVSEEELKISSNFIVIICTFRHFGLPWFRCPEQNCYVLKQKKTKKTKLVDWQFEGTEWIIRFGEKNLEIVLSWNWKQKSIFGILETEAVQKKNENGRSLKFSVLKIKLLTDFLMVEMMTWGTEIQ